MDQDSAILNNNICQINNAFFQLSESLNVLSKAISDWFKCVNKAILELSELLRKWLEGLTTTWQRKKMLMRLVNLGIPFPISKFISDHIPKFILRCVVFK